MNVSIIIPTYNNEKTIKAVLDSVLNQVFNIGNFEVIVIDDLSNDKTREIIFEYKKIIKIYNVTNNGLAKNINKGIYKSSNEYIVTLHADTIPLTNDWLKSLVSPLQNGDVIATCSLQFPPTYSQRKLSIWENMLYIKYGPHHALNDKADAYKKKLFDKIGLFDENHYRTAGEDEDIAIRLKSAGRVLGTSAEVLHNHYFKDDVSILKQILFKEYSFGMAGGALRRKYPFHRLGGYLFPETKPFYYDGLFRVFIILSSFIPYIQYVSFPILIIMSSIGIRKMFVYTQAKNNRYLILVYPIFNIMRFFIYSVGYFVGLVLKRQS